jgi:hypothetical protein
LIIFSENTNRSSISSNPLYNSSFLSQSSFIKKKPILAELSQYKEVELQEVEESQFSKNPLEISEIQYNPEKLIVGDSILSWKQQRTSQFVEDVSMDSSSFLADKTLVDELSVDGKQPFVKVLSKHLKMMFIQEELNDAQHKYILKFLHK